MKIKVNRQKPNENELVFTITVKDPESIELTDTEWNLMGQLANCQKEVESMQESKEREEILRAITIVRERIFIRVINSLKFAIKHQLENKFDPICQEIYNWIYDKQSGRLQSWLQEFDAMRTTYYFDNDAKCEDTNINDDDDEEED
jgi:hypothetical protein